MESADGFKCACIPMNMIKDLVVDYWCVALYLKHNLSTFKNLAKKVPVDFRYIPMLTGDQIILLAGPKVRDEVEPAGPSQKRRQNLAYLYRGRSYIAFISDQQDLRHPTRTVSKALASARAAGLRLPIQGQKFWAFLNESQDSPHVTVQRSVDNYQGFQIPRPELDWGLQALAYLNQIQNYNVLRNEKHDFTHLAIMTKVQDARVRAKASPPRAPGLLYVYWGKLQYILNTRRYDFIHHALYKTIEHVSKSSKCLNANQNCRSLHNLTGNKRALYSLSRSRISGIQQWTQRDTMPFPGPSHEFIKNHRSLHTFRREKVLLQLYEKIGLPLSCSVQNGRFHFWMVQRPDLQQESRAPACHCQGKNFTVLPIKRYGVTHSAISREGHGAFLAAKALIPSESCSCSKRITGDKTLLHF